MFDFFKEKLTLSDVIRKQSIKLKFSIRKAMINKLRKRKKRVPPIRKLQPSVKKVKVNKSRKCKKSVIRKVSVVAAQKRRHARMQRFIAHFKKLAESPNQIKNSPVVNQERRKSEMSSAYKRTPNEEFSEDEKGAGAPNEKFAEDEKEEEGAGSDKIDYKGGLKFENGKLSACEIKQIKRSEKNEKTIHEALHLILSSESVKNPKLHLVPDVVGQLVKEEKLNYLVLNLYNLSDGFEVFTKGAKTKEFLCKMSYEGKDNWGGFPVPAPRLIDGPGIIPPKSTIWYRQSTVHPIQHSSFLDEIDRGEAPYKLLIMLKDLKDKFMYGNIIIIKVNDFITEAKDTMNRKISPFFSFFSLLKPSYETLKLISRIKLRKRTEAELLRKFSDPLYLDPTPVSMCEKFKMRTNSLSNPKLNEILQNKWHSTLAEARNTDSEPLSGFTGYLKTKQKIEDIVDMGGEKHDFVAFVVKSPELCNQSYPKIATMPSAPTFADFLKKRTVKSEERPLYTIPVLLEEFAFEYIKVNEDGSKETMKRTYFSVFETKKGFYAKVYYTGGENKKVKLVNSYEVANVPQLNIHLVRHAKLISNVEGSNYLKVFHKIPTGAAYVAFDNVPFDPAQIADKNDYREDKDLNADENCENTGTDSEKISKDNDSGETSNRH